MSITFKIPQSARFLSPQVRFTAAFNVPVLGGYGFGVAANAAVVVMPLQVNSVYLIERMSIGGDMGEETYLESIATTPQLRLSWQRGKNENIYANALPVVQFVDNQEVAAWVITSKSNDNLTATFTGILNQVPATVGRATLSIVATLSIYQVSSNWYNTHYKSQLAPSTGMELRD